MLVYMTLAVSCKNSGAGHSGVPEISTVSTHTLNIQDVLGKQWKVLTARVKRNLLLLAVTDEQAGSYFVGVDLTTSKKVFTVKDPTMYYYSSCFDVQGDSLIYTSGLHADSIFLISLKNGDKRLFQMAYEHSVVPGNIYLKDQQLFLFTDVYGINFINLASMQFHDFRSRGPSGVGNIYSSIISYPVSDPVTLLSGQAVQGDSVKLNAVNKADSVIWSRIVEPVSSSEGGITPLDYGDFFIVNLNKSAMALSKKDGSVLWQKEVSVHKNVLKWKDKIVEYSYHFDNNKDIPYTLALALRDSKAGDTLWNFSTNCADMVSLGICNNKLLKLDKAALYMIDLASGKQEKQTLPQGEQLYFKPLMDEETGGNYLYVNDQYLYW
jgi:hypothetical protein